MTTVKLSPSAIGSSKDLPNLCSSSPQAQLSPHSLCSISPHFKLEVSPSATEKQQGLPQTPSSPHLKLEVSPSATEKQQGFPQNLSSPQSSCSPNPSASENLRTETQTLLQDPSKNFLNLSGNCSPLLYPVLLFLYSGLELYSGNSGGAVIAVLSSTPVLLFLYSGLELYSGNSGGAVIAVLSSTPVPLLWPGTLLWKLRWSRDCSPLLTPVLLFLYSGLELYSGNSGGATNCLETHHELMP